MTEWEIIDALTDDMSKFGFTYREAGRVLQEIRQRFRADLQARARNP